jgi:hypothetical protein
MNKLKVIIILSSTLSLTVFGNCKIEMNGNLYESNSDKTTASKIINMAESERLNVTFNGETSDYGIIRSNYILTEPKLDNFGILFQEYSSRLELYHKGFSIEKTKNSIKYSEQVTEMIEILKEQCS